MSKEVSPRFEKILELVKSGGFFETHEHVYISRAPGRLDVMGGISDYSGSLVLQLPVAEGVYTAAQKSTKNHSVRIRRTSPVAVSTTSKTELEAEIPLSDFFDPETKQVISYSQAHAYFSQSPQRKWTSYVAGVFLVIFRELGVNVLDHGVNVFVDSNLPEQKGVASSAAVEVATMRALCGIFNLHIDPRRLAFLCQMVENLIVGAPCGIMDQMTSAFAQKAHFLALLCQPAEVLGQVKLPEELYIWGIDSGIKHTLSDPLHNPYANTRVANAMGKKIIEKFRSVDYLANLSPSEFEVKYEKHLPVSLLGKDFIKEYGQLEFPIYDSVEYKVRAATFHPIIENFRVKLFNELLLQPLTDSSLSLLGELMFQSNQAYNKCGLGTEQTDLLVDLVREKGLGKGLYGARVSGGGSGGTIVVLGKKGSDDIIEEIVKEYQKKTGQSSLPYLFVGSSSIDAVVKLETKNFSFEDVAFEGPYKYK
eukprot:TRINITY_DN2700_c0_g1_i1.p1 TRINITY_DN2700_c0_g1~~TRINITY_DN2700_c0_g1_i1.p1  ORF type:complete len:479 (-),score=81.26 TRINITY_DN2700_c0_g1_i1:21-1457(-)